MSSQLSRHVPGVHHFEFFTTLCIIGIGATLILEVINVTQKKIERIEVETEVNNFRLSITESWVHKNVMNQSTDFEKIKDDNPMTLVNERPENYIGEVTETPKTRKAIWYFDKLKKRLIYLYNDGETQQFRIVKTAGRFDASRLSFGGIDLIIESQSK